MDRRNFFKTAAGSPLQSKSGNKILELSLSLDPYNGKWDKSTAAHLLRRASFAYNKANIEKYAKKNLTSTINDILAIKPIPNPPIDPTTGLTWHDKPFNSDNNGKYLQYLRSWWMGMMIDSGVNIREKITLFWHNHFPTSAADVGDARYLYIQNETLRRNSLGNIKTYAKEITKDPAMLRYLNGNTNVVNKPNENYGREFLELFTIGKREEIAPGNYTTYTEDDVKAAARVFTGWSINYDNVSTIFRDNQHDTKDKQFSSAFNNYVVKGKSGPSAGDEELADIVDMIFSQKETAMYLTRKLYQWFVYYEITDEINIQIISPLADIMMQNDYDIIPVLRKLLSSKHFFDANLVGAMIKNPVDFATLLANSFNIPIPQDKNSADYYTFYQNLNGQVYNLQMGLLYPPAVAGWDAYWVEPDYYRLWINSSTLPLRFSLTDNLISGGGTFKNMGLDSIAMTKFLCTDPTDVQLLITDWTNYLYPNAITQEEQDIFTTKFTEKYTTTQWKADWESLMQTPDNTQLLKKVKAQLDYLVKILFRNSEFQLM